MQSIYFKRLTETAIAPTRAHQFDSGLDLYSDVELVIPPIIVIQSHQSDQSHLYFPFPDASSPTFDLAYATPARISTGIAIELEEGFEAQIRPKSGLSAKGFLVALGTIDHGYTGDLQVVAYNFTGADYVIKPGQKIAQLVIAPVVYPTPVEVDQLGDFERADKGFGSTGLDSCSTGQCSIRKALGE